MDVRHVSFVGRSNSGKTTLITRLIPILCSRRLKVGTIKHTHHQAEFDTPGKDSWQHRQSGSQQVLLMSHDQQALYTERPAHLTLKDAVHHWFSDFDLVISEGFKNEPGLKVEVFRHASGKQPLYKDPAFNIQALVSEKEPESAIQFFHFEEIERLSDWILSNTGLK